MTPSMPPPAADSNSAQTAKRAGKKAGGKSGAKPDDGLTPAMRQYMEQKAQVGDAILLFRIGDFYETFYDDARTIARVLGLTLTARSKDTAEPVPLAGVPHHSVTRYIARLVRAGYKVAVSEQMEDPRSAKGVIKREVVRVITPGTLTDEAFLDARADNFLAALCPVGGRWPGSVAAGHSAHPLNSDAPHPTSDIRHSTSHIGLACVELASGRFFAEVVPVAGLLDELGRLRPAELVIPEFAIDEAPAVVEALRESMNVAVTQRPGHVFDRHMAEQGLCKHFGVASLDGFGFDQFDEGLCAAAALLDYLQETQKASLGHILKITPRKTDDCVHVDQVTLRALEVERTIRENARDGSMLAAIDRTANPMGARRLREWLCFPLSDARRIIERQDAIAALVDQPERLTRLRELLRGMSDVERIAARLGVNRSSPRDLLALGRTLLACNAVREAIGPSVTPPAKGGRGGVFGRWNNLPPPNTPEEAVTAEHGDAKFRASSPVPNTPPNPPFAGGEKEGDLLTQLADSVTGLDDLGRYLTSALKEDAPPVVRDGGFIADGHHPELDRLRRIDQDGSQWLAEFQAREVAATGIGSLKVGYNAVFGYYIEITHTHRDKVPPHYVRKQTVRNAERYITEDLKRHEDEVTTAAERAKQLEIDLFDVLRAEAAAKLPKLQVTAEAIATLDVLCGLADLARRQAYCRPQIADESGVLEIEDGRHPVLDLTMSDRFVPNDCRLSPDADQILLITGPNMAGKSTYIRQVALLTLLAHTGSSVPARSMRWSPVDRIFARVGASDELARGQSTFMVEMVETARILNGATDRSLVILDEIGRGTSTYDGLAIAWAVTEYLAEKLGCRALFATHYHELTELAGLLPGVANFNVAVHEGLRPDGAGREVVFLHKIIPGPADRSYGVHVAGMAGLPTSVVKRSEAILTELESKFDRKSAGKTLSAGRKKDANQLMLFAEPEPLPPWWRDLVDGLGAVDVNATTPIEALKVLQRLQAMLHQERR